MSGSFEGAGEQPSPGEQQAGSNSYTGAESSSGNTISKKRRVGTWIAMFALTGGLAYSGAEWWMSNHAREVAESQLLQDATRLQTLDNLNTDLGITVAPAAISVEGSNVLVTVNGKGSCPNVTWNVVSKPNNTLELTLPPRTDAANHPIGTVTNVSAASDLHAAMRTICQADLNS